MNILKKLFGGQKTTEEVRETKEKDFDKVKYDGVRLSECTNSTLLPSFWNKLCS